MKLGPLPPKPPRFPPPLYSKLALFHYASTTACIACNALLAWQDRDTVFLLGVNCIGMAVGLWNAWQIVCITREALHKWREIRMQWARHNALRERLEHRELMKKQREKQ